MRITPDQQSVDVSKKARVGLSVGKSKQTDSVITILRWISIIGVLFQHANFQSRYSEETAREIHTLQLLTGWCVISFFAISGYLSKPSASIRSVVMNRAARLLVPYFFVSCIGFACVWAVNATGVYRTSDGGSISVASLFQGLVMLEGFGPQFYFLPYLFFISVLWQLLVTCIRGPGLWLGIIALAVAQAFWFLPSWANGPGKEKFVLYFLAYALGCAAARADMAPRFLPWLVLLSGLALGGGIFMKTGNSVFIQLFVPFLLYVAIRMIPAAERMGEFLAPFSPGAVYLWHAPLILPAASVFLHRAGIMNWGNFALACLVAVVASLLIQEVVVRLKLARWLSL